MTIPIDAQPQGRLGSLFKMLRTCFRLLRRDKILTTSTSTAVVFWSKSQQVSGDVRLRHVNSRGWVVSGSSGGKSLEDVLDKWRKQEKRGDPFGSHNSLSGCLYHVLKAARHQKLSSGQLMQNPHFQRFWHHLHNEVPSMSANSAVMCLYNCAQYGFIEDLHVFSSLTKVCSNKVQEIPSKAFGILLWSLCKLNLYQQNQPLIKDVVKQFHSELVCDRLIKPQSFANVLWALASTRTWPAYVTEGVTDYVSRRVSEFDFHSLSVVLWSVTSAQLRPPTAFLAATGDRAAALLHSDFHIISVIHCCWAFGAAAHYHQSFFSAVTNKLLSEPVNSPIFTPRLLSSVVWACARTGFYDSDLLDHVAQAALAKINDFNSQDLGNLAYAYGQLNHSNDQLLLTISEKMSLQEMSTNEQACANVANACLIHKLYPEALLTRLMSPERISGLSKQISAT